MSDQQTVLVVDGNNIAYRAFHTPQGGLSTTADEPSGVMLGVLNSLKGYLESFPETTRMVTCWDGGKAEWRKALHPEYKANRTYGEQDPEEKARYDGLFEQINILDRELSRFGIHSLKFKGWEADDLMYAVTEMEPGHKIIVSTDKDMLQLVSDHVSVYNLKMVVSPSNFHEVTGVTQEAYLGYRAMVGDTSDNIPGIHGIGDKTARKYMDEYGHIDNMLAATGDTLKKLMKSKVSQRLFTPEGKAILGRNHKMMNLRYADFTTIKPDIKAELNMDHHVGNTNAKQFLQRWQFASILAEYSAFIYPFMRLGKDE